MSQQPPSGRKSQKGIGTVEIKGGEAYFKSVDFTVLGWWKRRSPAFPVLSLVARDILAIPISTVASGI
nr:pleiotropic drug resistance ABC transporter family protein [Tanacetum cinerariifolium]GEZ45325.1 pleiotropic drug resistance ABC transporter family protein [Tanacetum cinerariifolium]